MHTGEQTRLQNLPTTRRRQVFGLVESYAVKKAAGKLQGQLEAWYHRTMQCQIKIAFAHIHASALSNNPQTWWVSRWISRSLNFNCTPLTGKLERSCEPPPSTLHKLMPMCARFLAVTL